MIRALLFAAAALLSLPAAAQVQQSGTITPGHTARWLAPNVVGDGGSAVGSTILGSGYLTELGITNTGTPLCINDALINAVGGYHQLCFGASALGGGLISYNAYGNATPLGLFLNINGTTYEFPFTVGGITGPGTTVIGDLVTWNSTTGTLVADLPFKHDGTNHNDFLNFGTLPTPNFSGGGPAECAGSYGQNNTGLGYQTLQNMQGSCNDVALGSQALTSMTTGGYNVAIGPGTMKTLTTGFDNTGVGVEVLNLDTTGYFNTAVGNGALLHNVDGYQNVAMGVHSLLENVSGFDNVCIGYDSCVNTLGDTNTALGLGTLFFSQGSTDNVALGFQAMKGTAINDTAIQSVAVGSDSQFANGNSTRNTTVGFATGQALVSGAGGNVAVGWEALNETPNGEFNTVVGYAALLGNSGGGDTPTRNVAIGDSALTALSTGQFNVVMGSHAGLAMTTGSSNVIVAKDGGLGITTGSNNILIGAANSAASQNQVTTGSQNICIGYRCAVPSATGTGQLDIGNFIYGTSLTGVDLTVSTSAKIGFGTQTPAHAVDVIGSVQVSNHLLNDGTAPAASTCGTSPAVTSGSSDNFGSFTTGTGTPTACTLTFASAYPANAFCVVTAANAAAVGTTVYVSAQSKTAFTITLGAGTDSAKYAYHCGGN